MIALSPEQAGRALGVGPLAHAVAGVSIDSRSIKAGDLFVALRGERFDGHDFVGDAFAAGAAAAVVEREVAARVSAALVDAGSNPGAKPLYVVDSTLEALWALAREVRRATQATVFAITGSVGKTSTKDLLRAMAGEVRSVVATPANQNNEVGVPLTLFRVQPDTEAVVLEMGMRGPGQIAQLAAVAEPDIGVITNIHPVHLELLGTLDAIARAKAELVAGLRRGGVAVVPGDCAVLQPYLSRQGCRVVRFGTDPHSTGAEVAGWIERSAGAADWILRLRWPEGEADLETGQLPAHVVANAVAAAAACYAAGLPVEVCAQGINRAEFSGGRGQLLTLPDLCIIDDTYNANPAAVKAAIDHLVRVAADKGGRPVAVLGDMLELGPRSAVFHREIGEYAAERGVSALWGVGPLSRATVEGYCARVCEKYGADIRPCAGHVASAEETSAVMHALTPGDVVLFKASRAIGLERMVRQLVTDAGPVMKEKR
jgi:UDP-N-acetylmuramoyl-tripeptide--D-alanyl-D-alanine ligase